MIPLILLPIFVKASDKFQPCTSTEFKLGEMAFKKFMDVFIIDLRRLEINEDKVLRIRLSVDNQFLSFVMTYNPIITEDNHICSIISCLEENLKKAQLITEEHSIEHRKTVVRSVEEMRKYEIKDIKIDANYSFSKLIKVN